MDRPDKAIQALRWTSAVQGSGDIIDYIAHLEDRLRSVQDTLDSLAGVKDPEFIRSQLYKALEGTE